MIDATEHANPPKRGIRVRLLATLTFAVAVLALGYLGTQYQSSAPAAPVEKLSIATPMVPHAALQYIAAAKGYFAEEGLEVTMIPTIHGKAAIDLVVQGKADLAAAADVPFVIAVMKGDVLGMVSSLVSKSDDNAIIARRDRAIAAPRDLLGKKVGVTFGTSGEYFLWAFLIRHKLAPDSVTLVDLPPGQIPQALARGTIDAVATWQPYVFDAQVALGENAVSFTETNAYRTTIAVIGRSDFLKGHPKAIEKLVRAMLKAEQFNRSEPEKALNLVAERLKIDAQALRPTWNDFTFRVNVLHSQLITLEDEARWAMARGYVEQGPVPNFLPHLYLDALLAVRPERVTVVR